MTVLANIVALRGLTSGAAGVVTLEGYTTAGDGGGGDFVYVASDTSSADNGVTIIVDVSGDRWYRAYSGLIDVRWAGAKCNGTTNDQAAVLRAAAVGPITFAAGVCYINTNITIETYATAHPGQLKVGNNRIVTFNGGFNAPIAPVFQNATAGLGTIVFNRVVPVTTPGDPPYQSTVTGYPEWWGGLGNNVGSQSLDAWPGIQAAVVACPEVVFQGCTYYTSATIVLGSNTTLTGTGPNWFSDPAPGAQTRICIMSSTLDNMLIGTNSNPGGISSFTQGVRVRDIDIDRTVACTPAGVTPGPGKALSGPSGIRQSYCLGTLLERVTCRNHSNGFYYYGCVACRSHLCSAAIPGSVSTDYSVGFNNDQSAVIGLASGDASLYFENCGFTGNGASNAGSMMFYFPSGFTDTYLDHCESSFCSQAILGYAESSASSGQDFHVENCIFDSCYQQGVSLTASALEYTITLTFNNVYVAAGAVNVTLIQLGGLSGAMSIAQCQLLGDGSTTLGYRLTGCNGIIMEGNQLSQCGPQIVIANCYGFRVADVCNHSTSQQNSAMIAVTNSQLGTIAPIVRGNANNFLAGVTIDSSSQRLLVDCTGIDSGIIAGGAANKIVYNGSSWGRVANFGTNNMAVGIFA